MCASFKYLPLRCQVCLRMGVAMDSNLVHDGTHTHSGVTNHARFLQTRLRAQFQWGLTKLPPHASRPWPMVPDAPSDAPKDTTAQLSKSGSTGMAYMWLRAQRKL
jgi:hypothetical protein